MSLSFGVLLSPSYPAREDVISLITLVYFLQRLAQSVITLFVCLIPSTTLPGKLPKEQDTGVSLVPWTWWISRDNSKPARPESLAMTRTGAALNRYTHQFTFLALVLGAEVLGRHRGPGGATSRPPRASAPAAVAPRSAPSGAAPAAAHSGGAGWQEHCALGDEQVTAGEPGAPRRAGIELMPHRAPLRPQLLPGERVADPVAPPLLRLLTQPLGLRLLPGPVPAVSAVAPRGHRRAD